MIFFDESQYNLKLYVSIVLFLNYRGVVVTNFRNAIRRVTNNDSCVFRFEPSRPSPLHKYAIGLRVFGRVVFPYTKIYDNESDRYSVRVMSRHSFPPARSMRRDRLDFGAIFSFSRKPTATGGPGGFNGTRAQPGTTRLENRPKPVGRGRSRRRAVELYSSGGRHAVVSGGARRSDTARSIGRAAAARSPARSLAPTRSRETPCKTHNHRRARARCRPVSPSVSRDRVRQGLRKHVKKRHAHTHSGWSLPVLIATDRGGCAGVEGGGVGGGGGEGE